MNLPEVMKVTESPTLYIEEKLVGKIQDWNSNPLGGIKVIMDEEFISTRDSFRCEGELTNTEVFNDTIDALRKTAHELSFTFSLTARSICNVAKLLGKEIKKIKKYRNMMKYYRMMEQRKPKKVRR